MNIIVKYNLGAQGFRFIVIEFVYMRTQTDASTMRCACDQDYNGMVKLVEDLEALSDERRIARMVPIQYMFAFALNRFALLRYIVIYMYSTIHCHPNPNPNEHSLFLLIESVY